MVEKGYGGEAGVRAALLVICLILVFCQGAGAFNLSHITIDPKGSLMPGTPVNITGTIDFIPVSDDTFPSGSELVMSTDLEKPKWSYSLILDGVDTPRSATSGRVLVISGWVLSHPSSIKEVLKVTLEGNAPTVSYTSNKTLIKICEFDSHKNLNSCIERTVTVVDTCCIVAHIPEAEADLQTYRSYVDEKSTLGVDTSAAEAKYSEADQKIKSAKGRKSTQYLLTFSDLDAAKKAIADGEFLLDKAWAEKEVTDAQVPINNVDNVIAWFKGNASTQDDAQLPAIIAKREVAVSYISTAKDHIKNGNYAQAREKAQDAFNKGNESYTDALQRSGEIRNPDYFNQIIWYGIPPACKCGPVFAVFELAIAVVITGIKIALLILPVLGVYYLFRKRRGAKPE